MALPEVRFSFSQAEDAGKNTLQCDVLVDKDTDPATPFDSNVRITLYMTLDDALQAGLTAIGAVVKGKFLEAVAAATPPPVTPPVTP